MFSSVVDYDMMRATLGRYYLGVSDPPEFFSLFEVFVLGGVRGCPTRSDNMSASDGHFASLKHRTSKNVKRNNTLHHWFPFHIFDP